MQATKAGKIIISILIIGLCVVLMGADSCSGSEAEKKDRALNERQQLHYNKVQPVDFFGYSIPRYVFDKIYEVVCTEARATYTVIETITGVVKYRGPAIGYGIPADTSITNPLQPAYGRSSNSGEIIEQAEPNGLFSSKNTNGTWVLFLMSDGSAAVVYTEQLVTTFPFVVNNNTDGEWIMAEGAAVTFTIDVEAMKTEAERVKEQWLTVKDNGRLENYFSGRPFIIFKKR